MVLDRALAYAEGTHTQADIEAAVATGDMQRWDGDHSVIVTEVRQAPRRRILNFFLAEGNLVELRTMVPPILAWGKEHGCTSASMVGRFGWQRTWLVTDGWKAAAVVMERDL